MGRGDLIRRVLIVAALAAAAASTAAAAVGVHWNVLAKGATMESSSRRANGYIAITKVQEARFASRLSDRDRAAIGKVDLQKTGLVAVFLDGIPCARDITVTGVTRSVSTSTVTVTLHWTRPAPGAGMCVQLGAPYAVIGVTRASLGRPAPQHVRIVAFARS